MLIENYGKNAFGKMKDQHYWFLLEPIRNSICSDGIPGTNVRLYKRVGPGHLVRKQEPRKSFLRRLLDSVGHVFCWSSIELQDSKLPFIESMDIMDTHIPDWIVQHFEKFKTLPGTFYFFEIDGKLYYSLRPVSFAEDDEFLEPCSYAEYQAVADTFDLAMPPATNGKDCPWIFDRLGVSFADEKYLRAWRELVYTETGNLVFLARA